MRRRGKVPAWGIAAVLAAMSAAGGVPPVRAVEPQPALDEYRSGPQPYLVPNAEIPRGRHPLPEPDFVDAMLAGWVQQKDWASIVAYARDHADPFCPRPLQRCLLLARAQAESGRFDAALDSYARAYEGAGTERQRGAILQAANENLPPGAVAALAGRLQDAAPGLPVPVELKNRLYAWRLGRAADAHARGEHAEAARLIGAVRDGLLQRRDADAARLAAAVAQSEGRRADMYAWLARAAQWSGEPDDRYRIAEERLADGEYASALQAADELPEDDPARLRLRREAQLGLARAAYAGGDYERAAERFGHVGDLEPADLSLWGWSLFHLGDYAGASARFAEIYRRTGDEAAARALVLADHRRGAVSHSVALARELGGVLPGYMPLDALTAVEADGGDVDRLALRPGPDGRLSLPEPVATPVPVAGTESGGRGWALAGGGLGWRERGGEGPARLRMAPAPGLYAGYRLDGRNRFEIAAWRVALEADAARPDDLAAATPAPDAVNLTRTSEGEAFLLGWRRDGVRPGDRRFDAALGRTPGGGPVASSWQGVAGMERGDAASGWRLELCRSPLRESLLSYVGSGLEIRVNGNDYHAPFSWGRVLRNAVGASGYLRLDARWQLSGSLSAAWFDGHNVQDNRALELYATALRDLGPGDAAGTRLRLGPELLMAGYAENQNHFTPGYGGYFSPESMLRLGALLEHHAVGEGRWRLRSRVHAGFQWQREAAARAIPVARLETALADAMGADALQWADYAATSDRGFAGEVEFAGVRWLGEPGGWAAGGWLRLRHSPGYDDTAAMLFLLYRFGGAAATPAIPDPRFDRRLY